MEDASPIRRLFNEVKDRIPDEVSENLGYAAYIEGMQIPVSRALQRMADRAQMAKTQEEVDSYKHRTQEVHHKINFLENCRPDIVGAIDRLKRRRAELAKEMK
ncbi:hypothetical protein C2845_PM09G06460 [Panicum miliaceum]|uniref:DUF1409 domain-containing protein n=1 Tax=Panicum miliaceum TaxID=4540 RepID=A0A3L6RYF6_PANMI|nr:hypothetical protein C2845_PM09G06460 [Panicum miliaceum]